MITPRNNDFPSFRTRRTRVSRPSLLLVGAVLLVFVLLFTVGPWRRVPSRSSLLTVSMVKELDTRSQQSGKLADAIAALQAYATLAHQVGDMRRAVQSTLNMIDSDPAFAALPATRVKRAKLETEWDRFAKAHGVTSDAVWEAMLIRGDALATTVLARRDVTDDARQLAWLARAKLAFVRGNYQPALEDISRVLGREPDSVVAHCLQADIYAERREYESAVHALQQASASLSAWAKRAPPWELQLAWLMYRPRAAFLRRDRWEREQRQLAQDMQRHLATEIRVLRDVMRAQEHTSGERASPGEYPN